MAPQRKTGNCDTLVLRATVRGGKCCWLSGARAARCISGALDYAELCCSRSCLLLPKYMSVPPPPGDVLIPPKTFECNAFPKSPFMCVFFSQWAEDGTLFNGSWEMAEFGCFLCLNSCLRDSWQRQRQRRRKKKQGSLQKKAQSRHFHMCGGQAVDL